jgi:hypothetical protein
MVQALEQHQRFMETWISDLQTYMEDMQKMQMKITVVGLEAKK